MPPPTKSNYINANPPLPPPRYSFAISLFTVRDPQPPLNSAPPPPLRDPQPPSLGTPPSLATPPIKNGSFLMNV